MTEAEWAKSDDPEVLLDMLGAAEVSERKLRLFACACCRLVWDRFRDSRCVEAVVAAEAMADGSAETERCSELMTVAFQTARGSDGLIWLAAGSTLVDGGHAAILASRRVRWAMEYEPGFWRRLFGRRSIRANPEAQQATLLRDIFTDPARPVAFDPRWQTETTVSLAETIYADRAFDRLPILADALQDAGCESEAILGHCRGSGPHVRGCWVVDFVLGKS